MKKTKGNGDNYEAPSPFQSGLLNLYNQDFSSMYSYPSLNDNSIENTSMNFENIDPKEETWHYLNEDKSVGIYEVRHADFSKNIKH